MLSVLKIFFLSLILLSAVRFMKQDTYAEFDRGI